MSKRYHLQRAGEIRKKKAREKSKEKPKIIITNEIICTSCGKFSGWTNDDLKFISGEREIKCTNCGKPCIKTLCKKKSINNNNSYE